MLTNIIYMAGGIILGAVSMAVLAGCGRGSEIEKETILRDALRKTLKYYYKRKEHGNWPFPLQTVKDALELD